MALTFEADLPRRRMNRRSLLRTTFWTGFGMALLGAIGGGLHLIYPRGITGFGSKIVAGPLSNFSPGTKTANTEGRFWLVNLTEEQGGPGLLALWWKCPHLGCTVPWVESFTFTDPNTGQSKAGWFRCPCHGSTYTDAGVRVWGPAPRSLDTMDISIENDQVVVNTGAIRPGGPDNASRALKL